MNAVVAIEEFRQEERIPGRDRSWIEASLASWGSWIWKHRDFEGYPTSDNIVAYIYGAGGSQLDSRGSAHRILCRDPPKWIAFTHVIVMMLPEHEGVTVFAEYVPGVDDDGRILSRAERCLKLGIHEETFRKRLQRATVRIWKWSRARRG